MTPGTRIRVERTEATTARPSAVPPAPHFRPGPTPRDRARAVAPRLSVVVPAYNEARRIEPTLIEVLAYLDALGNPYEVLVVDDGSTDGTDRIVTRVLADHPTVALLAYRPNRGKGHAVRTGVLEATGDRILLCDADLATPIEELDRLQEWLDAGCHVAIGSRALPESLLAIRQPWYRELAGRALNQLVRRLAVPRIRDTQCGFKLFQGDTARALFRQSREDGFGFDIEVLHRAHRLGHTIAEVPVRWRHQDGSKVRLMRDSVRMMATIARVRLSHGVTR